jgi:elongator complex protein 3
VEGNKRTSLRQDVQAELARRGQHCQCIRCREVRGRAFGKDDLRLDDQLYPAGFAEEHFLTYVTPADQIAAFLRLSLPGSNSPDTGLNDLHEAALREVTFTGRRWRGDRRCGSACGLGTRLIERASAVPASTVSSAWR